MYLKKKKSSFEYKKKKILNFQSKLKLVDDLNTYLGLTIKLFSKFAFILKNKNRK